MNTKLGTIFVFMLALTSMFICKPAQAQENLVKQGEDFYEAGEYNKAFGCFTKAADQGNATAQYKLGLMYDKGQGVQQDYKEAVKWYRKAAEQGHAKGQFNLGVMYYYGDGVQQDYKEAVKWYRKAAEQGHNGAIEALKGF